MKYWRILILSIALTTITCSQVKDYYWYAPADIAIQTKELAKQNIPYKPFYIIYQNDTLSITQISQTSTPKYDTHPQLIGIGVVERYEVTTKAIYIHLKQFRRYK